MNYLTLKEEPLKNAVKDDFFGNYKYTQLGNIDFVIAKHNTDRGALLLSEQAKAVYDAGLELWRYYHSYKDSAADASFYDIRKYFQGEKNGRMNNASEDERYTEIVSRLRLCEKALGDRIAEKTYAYGFLK